ncbi:MAG: alpha/beta hydrolase [Proteobacteria bacterium]|nr:alpha/beta hydrolase [Pseudomonadota bacterium]
MKPENISWTLPGKEGLTIRGLEWGKRGPVVLLHHANGMCAHTWQLVAADLATQYHVFAIDARGHGDSGAPPAPAAYTWGAFSADLHYVARAILKGCNQQSVRLGIGSSFGGIVTCITAAGAPDLFDQIIMLDPPIHPDPETLRLLGVEFPDQSSTRDIVTQTRKRQALWPDRAVAAEKWRSRPVFRNWQQEAFDLYIQHGLRDLVDGVELKCDPEVEATIFDITRHLKFLDWTGSLEVPILIAHAADSFFPVDLHRAIAARMKNAKVVELDGGHMLPMEVPHKVVALIRQFAALGSAPGQPAG